MPKKKGIWMMQGQAAAGGVDAVLLVEGHHLLVHPPPLLDVGLGLLVLVAQGLDLGLELGHLGHRLGGAVGQREEDDLDDQGQDDDRPAPVGEGPVDDLDGGKEDLGEDAEGAEAHELLGVGAEVGQPLELLGAEIDAAGPAGRQEEVGRGLGVLADQGGRARLGGREEQGAEVAVVIGGPVQEGQHAALGLELPLFDPVEALAGHGRHAAAGAEALLHLLGRGVADPGPPQDARLDGLAVAQHLDLDLEVVGAAGKGVGFFDLEAPAVRILEADLAFLAVLEGEVGADDFIEGGIERIGRQGGEVKSRNATPRLLDQAEGVNAQGIGDAGDDLQRLLFLVQVLLQLPAEQDAALVAPDGLEEGGVHPGSKLGRGGRGGGDGGGAAGIDSARLDGGHTRSSRVGACLGGLDGCGRGRQRRGSLFDEQKLIPEQHQEGQDDGQQQSFGIHE